VLVSSFDISDGTGLLSYKWYGGSVTEAPELNADIEEADLRTVLHALHATKNGPKRLVVLPIGGQFEPTIYLARLLRY